MLNICSNKINNEQKLFENKINLGKTNFNIRPKILFRNEKLNRVINGIQKSIYENKMLSEDKITSKIKYICFDSFKKTNALKLPSLSEKYMKIKDFLKKNKKNVLNCKKEEEFNNYINTDDKRKKFIDNIMKSCCSVKKMNIPSKQINNIKECFLCYKLKNKDINYKPIFLYKNKVNYNKNIINEFKRIKFFPMESLNEKNIKILISEETMTKFNNKYNKYKDNNKNTDNNLDYFDSSKLFNKFNSKMKNFHLSAYNYNSEYKNNIKY